MTTNQPPPEVLAAALNAPPPPPPSEDKLTLLKQGVVFFRKLEAFKAKCEDRLKQTNVLIEQQKHKVLPDLLDELQIPKITVSLDPTDEEAAGGLKWEAKAEPYYRANIPADWPEADRERAFDWLTENGHGDIIKVDVIVSFPKEKYDEALALQQALMGEHVLLTGDALANYKTLEGMEPEGEIIGWGHSAVQLKKNVPWQTLTSWLKEQYEQYKEGKILTLPPLDILGATVGRIVKLKNKDD